MSKYLIFIFQALIVTGLIFEIACVRKVTPTLTITDLRCEYSKDPLGIDRSHPRFSWILESSERAISQTAYQILVANKKRELERNRGDMWDSRKLISDESSHIIYKGNALQSGEIYYWKVRIWNQDNQISSWSDMATFQMGLLEEDEWKGEWIGANDSSISAPLLRKEFGIDGEIKKAHTYISGLGYYELYINHEKVGDHVLDPGTTDYDKRVLYQTYEVTRYLRTGENVIGVMLGNGWYKHRDIQKYGDRPKLLFLLNINLVDGRRTKLHTDESWKVDSGPIVSNSIWDGEIYDARLEKTGWDTPGYDDSYWENAVVVESPGGILDSQLLPPIKAIKTLEAVSITEPIEDIYVFDFGQNLTGWPRLSVNGPEGTSVILKTAEVTRLDMARMKEKSADGVEGLIDPSPNRSAKARDVYILKGGNGVEVYEPRFTYHGFRYVQVEGFPGEPTVENLEARVVHTSVEPTGSFTCSNSLINQIHQLIIWGQLSNLHSIPTDCPQRDERQGWMGDAHLTAEEAMYNFDMAAFYTKWLLDIQDSQNVDGSVPDVVPHHAYPIKGTPAWQVAYPIITWYMYQYYGDEQILKEHYPSIKRWVDYLGSTAKDHIVEWGRGDWVAPMQEYYPGDTSVPITSTGYYYLGTQIVASIANILGKSDDFKHYSELANNIKDSFNDKFLDTTTNQYGTGSQTSNAFPLYLKIVPEDNIEEVTQNLVRNIKEEHDSHLWTGILGTKALVEALPELGQATVLYEIVTKTGYPSWGYMISKGATTLWERWGGFRYFDSDMNSLNHIMFGSVDEFFYGVIAGIKPARPGYKRIEIKPHVLGDMKSAEASVKTMRGKVSSVWKRDMNSITINVSIPANSWADVSIPKMDLSEVVIKEGSETVWDDGSFVEGIPGVLAANEHEDYIAFEVGSGLYSFELVGFPFK